MRNSLDSQVERNPENAFLMSKSLVTIDLTISCPNSKKSDSLGDRSRGYGGCGKTSSPNSFNLFTVYVET